MGPIRARAGRAVAVHDGGGPADVLRATDRVLRSLRVETTATALVVRLDPAEPGATVRARWSSAGHPPPVLVRADGTTALLDDHEPDLLLGLDADVVRAEAAVELEPGATLLVYTDGLVERRGEHLDVGLQRLREELGSLVAGPGRGGGSRTDLSVLCDEVLDRMVPAGLDDDAALVAVRPLGTEPEEEVPVGASPCMGGRRTVLAAHPSSVSTARRLVAEEIEAHAAALASERRDAAVLAVSELATNALVHAGTEIRICVLAGPTGVRVEVRDGSAHSPVPRRHSVTAATGRGLRLVDASVDRWDVARHRDGKTVWFEVGRPPGSASADDVEAAPQEDRCVRVALLGVPLAAHWAWQEQAAGMLREHLLLTLEQESGAMERHAAASDALDLLREAVPEPRSGAGDATADVVLQLSTRSVQSVAALAQALASAAVAAGSGRMLAAERPAGGPVGAWLCAEVARQADGEPPRRWTAEDAGRGWTPSL